MKEMLKGTIWSMLNLNLKVHVINQIKSLLLMGEALQKKKRKK